MGRGPQRPRHPKSRGTYPSGYVSHSWSSTDGLVNALPDEKDEPHPGEMPPAPVPSVVNPELLSGGPVS